MSDYQVKVLSSFTIIIVQHPKQWLLISKIQYQAFPFIALTKSTDSRDKIGNRHAKIIVNVPRKCIR